LTAHLHRVSPTGHAEPAVRAGLLGHAVPPELNEGTTPSTIARKVGVGYATVMRIAENQRRWKVASNGVAAE
jgi:hypothetical protein